MIRICATVALCAALLAGGWYLRHLGYLAGESAGLKQVAALKLSYAQAATQAEADARKAEQDQADAIARIDAQHAKDLQNAKKEADRTIADLRAGTLRLRKQWTCPVPATAANTGKPDAAAELRKQGASDIVRLAAEADSQVRALQAVARAERQ